MVMCKLHTPDATYSDHLSVCSSATPLRNSLTVGTTPARFWTCPFGRDWLFQNCTVALKCLASQRRLTALVQRAIVKATVDPNIKNAVAERCRCDDNIEVRARPRSSCHASRAAASCLTATAFGRASFRNRSRAIFGESYEQSLQVGDDRRIRFFSIRICRDGRIFGGSWTDRSSRPLLHDLGHRRF